MAKLSIKAEGFSIVINTGSDTDNHEVNKTVSDLVKKSVSEALRKEKRQGGLLGDT